MNITGISLSGMQASMARVTANASNIANVASKDYKPVRTVQGQIAGGGVSSRAEASGADQVDLSDEMVGMLTAKIAFQANAKVLESVHKLDQGVMERLA